MYKTHPKKPESRCSLSRPDKPVRSSIVWTLIHGPLLTTVTMARLCQTCHLICPARCQATQGIIVLWSGPDHLAGVAMAKVTVLTLI